MVELLDADQYWLGLAVSMNWVPPTHTEYGVVQDPLTPSPWVADAAESESHPAAPESPEQTNTEMPWAAACDHMVL